MNGQPANFPPSGPRGYSEPRRHPAPAEAAGAEEAPLAAEPARRGPVGSGEEPVLDPADREHPVVAAPPNAGERIGPDASSVREFPTAPTATAAAHLAPERGPERFRRWPWVLLGGALGTVFGAGICVLCASFAVMGLYQQVHGSLSAGSPDGEDSAGESPYGWSYPYGHDFLYDGDSEDATQMLFTYDEIVSALPDVAGSAEYDPDTGFASCSAGAYQVGTLSGIAEGVYFLEGAPDKESRYFLFRAVSGQADPQKTRYLYRSQNAYLGNHFVSLGSGDLIVYLPADDDDSMYDASIAQVQVDEVLTSGLYRVGTDIPAGIYRIEVDERLLDVATLEQGAYVMSDSSFSDGTVVDERYVTLGSNQTIGVREGDWLELYGATATLEGEPQP